MKISKTATKEEVKEAVKLAKSEIKEWEDFIKEAKEFLKK